MKKVTKSIALAALLAVSSVSLAACGSTNENIDDSTSFLSVSTDAELVAAVSVLEDTTLNAEKVYVKLADNIATNLVIDESKTVVLDLNGYTISDSVGHTIENSGDLTIMDSSKDESGIVLNDVDGAYASVFNNMGGDFTLESGTLLNKDATKDGWYTLKNEGNVVINGGTVENEDLSSSNITNGWYNSSEVSTDDNDQYIVATITINAGNVTGGLNSLKNDEAGVAVINGGDFSNTTQHCVLNWNIITVNGGAYDVPTDYNAVSNGNSEGTSVGSLTLGIDFVIEEDFALKTSTIYGANSSITVNTLEQLTYVLETTAVSGKIVIGSEITLTEDIYADTSSKTIVDESGLLIKGDFDIKDIIE